MSKYGATIPTTVLTTASGFRDPDAGDSVDLTVLLVARNEERNIETCIRSCIEAVEEARREGVVRAVEYILVDSASTDRTVAIASRFPLRIIQLPPDWPLSCGAGCHVGLVEARGRFCAIINADVSVDRRWFANALPHMEPEVGAVTGVAKETLRGRTPIERLIIKNSSAPLSLGTLPQEVAKHPGGFSRGTFLLRTSAARDVGFYNPYFQAAEDMDMRVRLLRGGWKVLDLPILQCTHFWTNSDESLDLGSYLKTILRNSVGLGQMARYNRRIDPWIARQAVQPVLSARMAWNIVSSLSLTCLILAQALSVALAHPLVFGLTLLLELGLGILLVRKARHRGISLGDEAFATLWEPLTFSIVRIGGFLRGFAKTPRGPKDYPWPIGETLRDGPPTRAEN